MFHRNTGSSFNRQNRASSSVSLRRFESREKQEEVNYSFFTMRNPAYVFGASLAVQDLSFLVSVFPLGIR